jgi:hypothetical protein
VSSDLGVLTVPGIPPWVGGARFTLDGTAVGAVRSSTTGICCFSDGTTDGRFNYAVRQDSTLLEPIGSRPLAPPAIYRFGRDWSDPQPYVPLTPGHTYNGVTWAPDTDTFWVSRLDNETAAIEHWSRDGVRLATPVTVPLSLTGLALDPADGTLWAVRYRGNADGLQLDQFARDGRHLGTLTVATVRPVGSAAEFAWTPPR